MSEIDNNTIIVRLARPGVKACGPYRAGKDYQVPEAEGRRLIDVKGFTHVKPVTDKGA